MSKVWRIIIGIAGVVVVVTSLISIFGGGTRVPIGKDEIYYSGTATEADAKALGSALQSIGYFADREVSVLLNKEKDGTKIISFVVKDGIWDNAKDVTEFKNYGRWVAPTIGGLPIKVRLCDDAKHTKKEMDVTAADTDATNRLAVGTKDLILYSGAATEKDANALGSSLQDQKFFTNAGAEVDLAKGTNGTIVSFVVQDGAWDKPKYVDAFTEIGKQAADSVGGLPLKVRMINSDRETKKEIELK